MKIFNDNFLLQKKGLFYGSIILILSLALLLLPFFSNFEFRFYGDDYHLLEPLKERGLLGAINLWIDAYGIIYRPLGITIDYVLYALLGKAPKMFYLLSIFSHFIAAVASYYVIEKVFKNKQVGIFTALFFMFFPLNAIAYLQLTSIVMGINITIYMILLFLIHKQYGNSKGNSYIGLFFLLWIALLLIYEQIVGLVVVLVGFVFFKDIGRFTKYFTIAGFLIITATFLFFYMANHNNPKMISLKNLNRLEKIEASHVDSTKQSSQPNSNKTEKTSIEDFALNNDSKVDHTNLNKSVLRSCLVIARIQNNMKQIFIKLKKALYFIYMSILAGIEWIFSGNFIVMAIFMLCNIGITISFFKLIKYDNTTSFMPLFVIAVTGMIWCSVTLAPFLLYRTVKIPPYCFLISSVGLGAFIYSFISILLHKTGLIFKRTVLTGLMSIMMFLFVFSQYGYGIGLIEELDYWENIKVSFSKYENALPDDSDVILLSLPSKDNDYIFWLTRTTGKRYISHLLKHRLNVYLDLVIRKDGAAVVDNHCPVNVDLRSTFGFKWIGDSFVPVRNIVVEGRRYAFRQVETGSDVTSSISAEYDHIIQSGKQLPDWVLN